MKRLVLGAVLVLAPLGLAAQPVAAQPPAGTAETCTASFEAMTLEQVLDLAAGVGVPEANAQAMFAFVNKNDDEWICAKDLPGPEPTHFGFVDNQAVGLTRS